MTGCLALAAAGCGSDSDAESPAPGASETSLEVTLDADGPGGEGEGARTETISCAEGSGCREASELTPADFEPLPPETACTEIFGGPDTATIAGTLNGEPVEAELSRANGCEIERFERFTALLQSLFPGYQPGASLGL